ncbi:MAG: redoxin domain-containing protein [Vicinamibacteria bacterium]
MLLHALAVALPLFLAGPSSPAEAQAALQTGRHEEALALFKTAASRDKRCGPCHLGMAEAQYALRQYRDAIKSCGRALELGLADAPSRALAHNIRGMGLFKLAEGKEDELQAAEAEVRQAADLHPADPSFAFNLGALLLAQRRDAEGKAQLEALLARVPEGPIAESARRFIENPRRARVRFAPPFRVQLADGRELSLEALKGKITILDFWATWCPPCRAAIPDLKALSRKYAERPFVLVSISVDEDEAAWRSFLETNAMTWPQHHDPKAELARLFDVYGFPTYIVLDGEGAVVQEVLDTDPRRSLETRLKKSFDLLREMPAR